YRRFRRRGRRPRVSYTSPSPQPIVFQNALFTQHDLGTEPHRPDKPGNDFRADPLHDPDRESVGMRARTPDIDEGTQWQQRVGGDLADAALRPGFGEHMRKIGAFESSHVVALPDMVVTIGIEREVKPA